MPAFSIGNREVTHCGKAIAAAVITLVWVLGCSDTGTTDRGAQDKVVIRVDDCVLTLAEFNEYFDQTRMSLSAGRAQSHEALQQARLGLLLELVEEMIILRRAEELDLDLSPGELDDAVRDMQEGYAEEGFKDLLLKQAVSYASWKKALRRRLLVEKVIGEDLLKAMSVSPEEIKAYYETHGDEWAQAEVVRVRHILLQDEAEAERILEGLENGEDFAALARLHSVAPEGKAGGDMGWVSRGQLPESLEEPLFKTAPGGLSPVVKTPFGFHIFQVMEKREAGKARIEDCVEKIKERIREERLEAAYGPWLAGFQKRYDIEINKEIIQ